MNLSSRFALSESRLTSVLSNWTLAEHARLHGPGDSVMSDLEAMRQASALPYDHFANTPVKKTAQHLDRLKHRLGSLDDVQYDDEFTGRAISDCFKLFAGQQIKRFVAQASNQEHFAQLVRAPEMGVGFTVGQAWDVLPHELVTIPEAIAELQSDLKLSLEVIAIRASAGEDWGRPDSAMVEAAWLGEVACARLATIAIGQVALHNGGMQRVPLRAPASDKEDAPITYPFAA